MKSPAILAGAALILAACSASSTAPSPLRAQPEAPRVVLVSYDGISAGEVQGRLSDLSALGQMRAAGALARVIPVNPTLSSSAHISIATGATPQQTGVVSNTFHLPGAPPRQSVSGFEVTIDTETLWEAAQRQGKRVGAITFPGVDNTTTRRRADWGLISQQPIARSRLQKLTRNDFQVLSRTGRGLPRSYSPALTHVTKWGFTDGKNTVTRRIELILLDTTNDRRRNYNAVRLRDDRGVIVPDERRWFAIAADVATPEGVARYGSWSKVLHLHPAGDEVAMYWGAVSRNRGYPASYTEMIDRQAGFWPGPPDERLAAEWLERRGGIDPQTFIEQLERFSEFFTAATLLSMERMPWDLLLAYQPVIDEAEHQFRIVNDRQQWSTAENRQAGERVRRAAYAVVDRSIDRLSRALPPAGTLAVTGDHGLAALDTVVRLNRLLADWGFAGQENQRAWAAFTSGNLAHVYAFNPEAEAQGDELARRLGDLRAPDGQAVFEQVRRKKSSDHPNSGDIIAYAFPRFAMSSDAEGAPFSASRYFGAHGGLNHHREFHTLLGLSGRGALRLPEHLEQTEIAGLISGLLRIAPPAGARRFRSPGLPEENASEPHAAPLRSPRDLADPRAAAHPSSPSTSG